MWTILGIAMLVALCVIIAAFIKMVCEESIILGLALAVVLYGFLFAIVYSVCEEAKSPTFTLGKADWVCTRSHTVTTTTYIMTGKVLVPTTSSHNECDQYQRVQ